MAAAVPIVTQHDVDAAWEAYQDLVVEALDRPALFADRAHVERMTAAHARFSQLFMADTFRDNVVAIGGGR